MNEFKEIAKFYKDQLTGEPSVYNCYTCKDKLYIDCPEEESERITEEIRTLEPIYQKKCKCYLNRLFEERMKTSGLGDILEEIKNNDYVTKFEWQKKYKKLADDFVKSSDTGLIFSGTTGSGKTLLLGKTFLNLLHKGKEGYYMLWKNDSLRILNEYGKIVDNRHLDYICRVEVLYIDDFMKTMDNDVSTLKSYTIDLAWQIIDRRQRAGKKTMISTEWYSDDFEKMDKSLRGRLAQLAEKSTNWVQMDKQEDRDIRLMKFNDKF